MGLATDTMQGKWYDEVFYRLFLVFADAYHKWRDSSTRTPVVVKIINAAEAEFKDAYHTFYYGFLKDSPFVTDANLAGMGVPPRYSCEHHRIGIPKTFPVFDIYHSSFCVMGIEYRDSEKTGRGKPYGMHGAEIVWAILDAPPTHIGELTNS
jgi:hypothetical protein